MADDSIDILAAYSLKFRGNLGDHRTVRFGSGAGPKFDKVCKNLKEDFVTNGLPSKPTPAIASVTHVGSPENNSL